MAGKARYEYDRSREVLIRIPERGQNKIMYRDDLCWVPLTPREDSSYARAIYFGEGCWDRLSTISEEEAQQILKDWGYTGK